MICELNTLKLEAFKILRFPKVNIHVILPNLEELNMSEYYNPLPGIEVYQENQNPVVTSPNSTFAISFIRLEKALWILILIEYF